MDTPYWRLKQVMDAWCALWFWPVDKVGLLDGTDGEYAAESVDVEELLGGFGEPGTPQAATEETRPSSGAVPASVGSKPAPRFVEAGLLFQMAGDQPTLDEANMQAEGDYFYEVQKAGGVPKQRKKASGPAPKRRRPVIPLKDLNDWLDFLESMLGTGPVPDDSIGSTLDTLEELKDYEGLLLDEMWMDRLDPETRYPWMRVVREIAEEQGFLHWELEFALAFAEGGGFDLQVGNPPWVRPEWKEGTVLSEFEPSFSLVANMPESQRDARRDSCYRVDEVCRYVLSEVTQNESSTAFLVSNSTYALNEGGQPDLYRGFMCQVWDHMANGAIAGMIHPDTHLEGVKDGALRESSYRRLLVHGSFVNGGNWAFEASRTLEFGVHVYRALPGEIGFKHLAHLYSAATFRESLTHDGSGDLPRVKIGQNWDLRPHRERVVHVDRERLKQWRSLAGSVEYPPERTPIRYPVTSAEDAALLSLASVKWRLGTKDPHFARGFDESGARRVGLIEEKISSPGRWDEVVLKGPQIGVATPIAKQPPKMKNNDVPWDLTEISDNAVPVTVYRRSSDRGTFVGAQERWFDHSLYRELQEIERIEFAVRFRDWAERLQSLSRVDLTFGSIEEVPDSQYESLLKDYAKRPYSDFYRLAWREMIPDNGERSLFAAIIPPGVTHIHAMRSMTTGDDLDTALQAGFWSSLPIDYYLRATGRGHLDVSDARAIPYADPGHPLAQALLLRTLRLNCLTEAYSGLWSKLYNPSWSSSEGWALSWGGMSGLGCVAPEWSRDTPLRTEYERRAALVEIDALVSVWLGISVEHLIAAFNSRYGTMIDYEAGMFFDSSGRRISSRFEVYGNRQAKGGGRPFLCNWLSILETKTAAPSLRATLPPSTRPTARPRCAKPTPTSRSGWTTPWPRASGTRSSRRCRSREADARSGGAEGEPAPVPLHHLRPDRRGRAEGAA
ncbi:hypothetical protein R2F25_08595 [Streptomyces sp. UP1A-1]|nr:hypothetical protein [Streptomyces sp. UP1A-1]